MSSERLTREPLQQQHESMRTKPVGVSEKPLDIPREVSFETGASLGGGIAAILGPHGRVISFNGQ